MNYRIRPCETHEELAACVALQKEIWGYADRELYPLRLLVTLAKIGGHVIGAFTRENKLVGFVASMPAWRGKLRYYHSLSLGVRAEHENRGLGRTLKLRQREAALRAGINLVEWTFDPLRSKNAFFNIVRLGAIARRYLPDYYGPVESRLQGGLPSDRLVAEWRLKSRRVQRARKGQTPWMSRDKLIAEVPIPLDIGSLLQSHPERASAEQARVRNALQSYFARGLAITAFAADTHGTRYLIGPYED